MCAFPALTRMGWLDHEAQKKRRAEVYLFLASESTVCTHDNLNLSGRWLRDGLSLPKPLSHDPMAS